MYQPLIKFHPYPAIITQVLRIFDFALDTSLRQNAKKFAFARGLFVSLRTLKRTTSSV